MGVKRGDVRAGMFSSLNAEGAERGAEGAEKDLLGIWGAFLSVPVATPEAVIVGHCLRTKN